MTRFFGRHIAPEMLGLLLLEFGLTFALACALMSPDGLAGMPAGTMERALAIALVVGFTSFILGLYRPQLFMRTRSLLLNSALGGVLAFPTVWAVGELWGMPSRWVLGHDRFWPAKVLVVWIAALFLIRLGFMAAVRSNLFVRKVAVLGAPGDVAGTVAAIRAGRAGFFEVAANLPAEDPVALRKAGVRHALTTLGTYAGMDLARRDAFTEAGIELEPEPAFWEHHLKRVDIDHLTPSWFDGLDEQPPGRGQETLIRLGDIAISLGFLLFTLPLMALVAVVVRLESPGPVLYKQERVGLGGRSFVVLKFRSMKANAETRGPAWAQARDPRVTRVGSIMRRTRIDELPQLINVLRGEMSFIGPRPERPHFVEQLAEVIPFYRERARVKPGLTGWAQVNYPYGASVEDACNKLSYDLYYVKNRSVLLDLAILFATVRVILFQEGSR